MKMSQIAGTSDQEGPLDGEIVLDTPQEGTLLWLQLQEHGQVLGRELPLRHRLDVEHGQLLDQEDDGKCQYVRPDGRRCGAPRLLAYGICLVHAGGGADPSEIGAKGGAAKTRLRLRRQLLGIGPNRSADPRQIARLAAHDRAEEIAAALLAPLDDAKLSAMGQQVAALRILDATFPQQTVQLTVEMPADSGAVAGMGWSDMQALAAQLLGDTGVTEDDAPLNHAGLSASSGR